MNHEKAYYVLDLGRLPDAEREARVWDGLQGAELLDWVEVSTFAMDGRCARDAGERYARDCVAEDVVGGDIAYSAESDYAYELEIFDPRTGVWEEWRTSIRIETRARSTRRSTALTPARTLVRTHVFRGYLVYEDDGGDLDTLCDRVRPTELQETSPEDAARTWGLREMREGGRWHGEASPAEGEQEARLIIRTAPHGDQPAGAIGVYDVNAYVRLDVAPVDVTAAADVLGG